jgi:hypothetical protein
MPLEDAFRNDARLTSLAMRPCRKGFAITLPVTAFIV